MTDCIACANGDTSDGAPGSPGTPAVTYMGTGCLRMMHTEVIPLCQAHATWAEQNYKTLACAKCVEEDNVIHILDDAIWEVI